MKGLPSDSKVYSLTVSDGRLFAGLHTHGVYLFDERSETWFSVGLDGLRVFALLSYESSLYAGTDNGLYSARIPRVQPQGKAVTTWATVKQRALR